MIDKNRTVGSAVPFDHTGQFFDTDESRAYHVAAFLAEGYAAGQPLLVVARPIHWALVVEHLEARRVAVREAIATGRIVVKDAADTLRQISRDGVPDARLFAAAVGDFVIELASRTGARVRAYGEMVDLLAQRGDLAEAIALEELWNALGERTAMSLLCGYSSAHFLAGGTHRALLEICKAHTHVQGHVHDPLASWVLTAAHNGPSSLRH